MLDEFDLRGPPRRRIVLPLLLFTAACFTTFSAGVYGWKLAMLGDSINGNAFSQLVAANWRQGLTYLVACIGVLLAHEMGHFLMTIRYRVPASLPYFLPVPAMLTGTMGAVIVMDGSRADRKQLFDIGIAGPLAGLVLALPLVYFGMKTAPELTPAARTETTKVGDELVPRLRFGRPLLVRLVQPILRPELPRDAELDPNALYMAGWIGLLITGLNMVPLSQLDGGHVLFGLFGRRSRWIARGVLLGADRRYHRQRAL